MQYYRRVCSPLGTLTMASDGFALTGLWFEGQAHFAKGLSTMAVEWSLPIFDQTEAWLHLYFDGEKPSFTPALAPLGTPFQQSVWKMLLAISYGQTTTYGALAKQLAQAQNRPSMSAQAVGGAVGRNPISLIIPCHRVIGRDGSLTGYAGGIERKQALLTIERKS